MSNSLLSQHDSACFHIITPDRPTGELFQRALGDFLEHHFDGSFSYTFYIWGSVQELRDSPLCRKTVLSATRFVILYHSIDKTVPEDEVVILNILANQRKICHRQYHFSFFQNIESIPQIIATIGFLVTMKLETLSHPRAFFLLKPATLLP